MFNFGIFELGMMLTMAVVWIAIIIGVVALVVWLVRGSQTSIRTTLPAAQQTPLDILKMRYARGEISKEQYEQMRQDLGV